MHFSPAAFTMLFGMLFMLRRRRITTSLLAHGMVAASLARVILEQATLRQDGLASSDRSAMLPHLGRRRELYGLRLNTEPEQRLGRVLPDEPNLLLAHVPEFSYLRHDR